MHVAADVPLEPCAPLVFASPERTGTVPSVIKVVAVLAAFLVGPAVVITLLGWSGWLLAVPAGLASATIVVLIGARFRRSR